MSDWSKVRLHVVTGKGGTGKSTVAAALALALATSGRNVLLCEVEGRQGIARMFDVDPLPYEERRIAKGAPDHDGRAGQVHALHIDPESALLEYLAMYYKLGRAGKALDRFGVIDFATTIAPGVRDVLLTGKVYEAVQRPRRIEKRGDKRTDKHDAITYDAVVLDAPPTGRICQFLGVNSELAGLAQVGPIKGQADKVMALLRSPRPSRWPWPPPARTSSSARSRAARASPGCSTSTRSPTRSAGSPRAPPTRTAAPGRSTPCTSTRSRPSSSTSRCTTSSGAPGRRSTGSA